MTDEASIHPIEWDAATNSILDLYEKLRDQQETIEILQRRVSRLENGD